MEIEQHFGYC